MNVDPWHVFLEKEERNSTHSCTSCSGSHSKVIGMYCPRDPFLGTINYVIITFLTCCRLNICYIAAMARFRNAQGYLHNITHNFPACGHFTYEFLGSDDIPRHGVDHVLRSKAENWRNCCCVDVKSRQNAR